MKIKIGTVLFIALLFGFSVNALPKQETIGEWNNELLLRSERTTGLPGGREDLERTRLTIWMELTAPIDDDFSFGFSIKGNKGTDEADENLRNLDNSESNTLDVDQFYLDWNFSDDSFLRFGKSYMASSFSTMIWDKDIVTRGASYNHHWMIGSESESEIDLSFGSSQVEHIFNEETTLNYINLHHTIGFDGLFITYGGSAIQITNTETLIEGEFNLRRTNTNEALRLDFEIILLDLTMNFDIFDQSISLGFEAGQNMAVDDSNQMKRINFVIGNNQIPSSLQFNFHYQDIEQDATVAAFNDDDWWFATWTKGYRLSTSYGITEDTFIQVSYFDEEWRTYNTKRIFLELRSFF